MKEIIAVVAATAETRGIGYKGDLVSYIVLQITTW
jgi:hypothetical protein